MNTRICNLNSLSSVIDRLIIEYLKFLKFIDENCKEKIDTQTLIINKLKKELDNIIKEKNNNSYNSLIENRTYSDDTNIILDNIFKLCACDYVISKVDLLKINEAKSSNLDPKKIKNYILQVRDYLEFRAYIKNKIEKMI